MMEEHKTFLENLFNKVNGHGWTVDTNYMDEQIVDISAEEESTKSL